jgi:NADPH-dependent 2,4-dienoyl-CoA reductase/sulfur reductase-like enzyme
MADRFVIVGSGIAGLAAAEAIRERLPRASITMVSEEPHEFYSRPGLAYLLRGDIPEKRLRVRTPDDLRALNVRRLTARAEQICCDAHELLLTDRRRVPYDRLLLATGALAVPPSFPGSELSGVVKLDGLDDAWHILKLARRARSAVVIGGGITALELAEGLAARGVRVHYFLRGARYWSDVLDEAESDLILDRLRHEGITIHANTQIQQAIGTGGKLSAVETQAGEQVRCQMVAVAIGVRPRAELARAAGLKVDRGVLVDEFLESSAPDVFAAGDVAEIFDPRSGRTALDVLWPSALAQGQVAGENMAGGRRAYIKGIPFNVTQLAGLKTTIIGAVGSGRSEDRVAITRGESEAWRLLPASWTVGGRHDVNRVRLLVGERTLVGALVMGDQAWSRPLQQLIVGQADITPIRASLIGGGAEPLAQLACFYQQWNSQCENSSTSWSSR